MTLKLKPSARIKRIYLLIEGGSRADIERAILDYLGVLGWAKASPIFVSGGKEEGRVVLAIARKEINNVRAAFELSPLKINVIRASGTLKGLEK